VAAPIEGHHNLVVFNSHSSARFDEPTIELFRRRLVETPELRRQPAVTAIGDHSQRGVEVDVETHFTYEAIQVEKVDADAQSVLNSVSAGVTKWIPCWLTRDISG
jgi:hypothetical protein